MDEFEVFIMKCTRDEILELEKNLLSSDVRKSAEKINELLADDFVEFSSSGSEYHYKKGDVFQAEDDERSLNWEILNFDIKEIDDKCVLATYKVVKYDEIDERKRYSLRSSLWRKEGKSFKMFFHQGTLLVN